MTFKLYKLDQFAQELTLKYRDKKVLNESHKMRSLVPYGLERFWGEHLRLQIRLQRNEEAKSQYWKATWDTLVKIMSEAGIEIPNDPVRNETSKIHDMAKKLWGLSQEDQIITLEVLKQLCDCLVWWTQRYKTTGEGVENND